MPLLETKGAGSAQGFGLTLQQAAANYIEDVFSTWLYSGTGTAQTITNGIDLSGKGGMVWQKSRNSSGFSGDHTLYDTVRGSNNGLIPNLTDASANLGTSVTFNSSGFVAGNGSSRFNQSGQNMVSWTFRKQPKFFDVVTWTGNGANPRQIAHNLGSVPGCIIVKSTTRAENWTVYHRSLGNAARMALNTIDAQVTGTGVWGSTTPTSTHFTVSADNLVNFNGDGYVAYLFAHDAGGFGVTGTDNVISCGSFTNSGPLTTVNLGWEPQYVLTRVASTTGNWQVYDSIRGFVASGGNGSNPLFPNTSGAESSGAGIYPTSTGFQWEAGLGTYIYIAIRRGPMKTPTSGTSVFSANTSSGAEGTQITTNIAADAYFAALRALTADKLVADRLRGFARTSSGLENRLYTNLTSAETGGAGHNPAAFDVWNTGYKIGASYANASNVFWSFRRAPGFFDVVCYTGTGSYPLTVNHNLGVAPELIITKTRSTADSWYAYAQPITSPNANWYQNYLVLNGTNVSTSDLTSITTAPTSTAITYAAYYSASGVAYVNYLFASCPGVSKVGSYTGNGSSQTINCGFTGGARFVMVKRTNSIGNWMVVDTARGLVAAGDPTLYLNSTAVEVTGVDWLDPDSSGFIVNQESTMNANVNGSTYLFLAIA